MTSINSWKEYCDAKIRAGFERRKTNPEFPRLVIEAKARGFRPATLNELLADGNAADLYTWKGHVWVAAEP